MLSVVHGVGYHQRDLSHHEARTALLVGKTTHLPFSCADTPAVLLPLRDNVCARWSRTQDRARYILSPHSNRAVADPTYQVHRYWLCNVWHCLHLPCCLSVRSRYEYTSVLLICNFLGIQ
jgi:hypothetical protein